MWPVQISETENLSFSQSNLCRAEESPAPKSESTEHLTFCEFNMDRLSYFSAKALAFFNLQAYNVKNKTQGSL